MLFNSISFAFFLPVVFIVYWFVAGKNKTKQNIVLLISSYFFYACWDWRFLFLLLFSTILDFFTGLKMDQQPASKYRKAWFWASIIINIGFLGVFKYYNFFAASFVNLFANIGVKINVQTLSVILPVGISFYTFHGLSYVIDIYKGKIKAEKNFIDYSVFVCFFPLLVAGPIERATHLLPQIKQPRAFNYAKAVNGMRQILWGLFKKLVIADNCAGYANQIFNDPGGLTGSTLFIGALFFTFQIYGDFSGYSDIALGTARLFGVDLLRNFSYPYFSRDIAEFWRRWHISLSTWFKDYLYLPLGGSKGNTWMKIRNTLIIFLVSGFWHGANWTFIFWGLLNAIYIMPSIILQTHRKNLDVVAKGKVLPSFYELISIAFTFLLTVIAWIFFRSPTISQAFSFVSKVFSKSFFQFPQYKGMTDSLTLFLLIIFFMSVEWMGREKQYAIENLHHKYPRAVRWSIYTGLVFMIGMFMHTSETQFIYFQF